MCGFQDALSNLMPIDWMDPYGRTPFAKDTELSVDITIVETDDGIRAKSVKNPPTSGSSRLMTAIKNALGMGFVDCIDSCGTESKESVPQEKESDTKKPEKPEADEKESEEKPDSRPYTSTDNKTAP